MATGTGKTVVMAMLIAWQALNKFANPQDARFSDTFLIVTPGITIRDRLRVLLPNDPDNYYRKMDVVPPDLRETLNQAKVLVTNFHAFLLREKVAAGKLTKSLLAGRKAEASPFTETPDQMVRRVCRDFGAKSNIVVINDEAHHCYRRKPGSTKRREAVRRRAQRSRKSQARRRGPRLDHRPRGDQGQDRRAGHLRPLGDALLPAWLGLPRRHAFPLGGERLLADRRDRVRHRQGAARAGRRRLHDRRAAHLPRALAAHPGPPAQEGPQDRRRIGGERRSCPQELEGALHSLYSNYEKSYALWEQATRATKSRRARGADAFDLTPPVFIVVCNNTNVSKLVFDWISGWENCLCPTAETAIRPGQPAALQQRRARAAGPTRPNTILVDSAQLESGEAMSPEFKKIAAAEIEEFKAEYRARFPGRSTPRTSPTKTCCAKS